MLIIVGVVGLIVVVILFGMRPPRGADAAPIGWMSHQWLVEHRASHST